MCHFQNSPVAIEVGIQRRSSKQLDLVILTLEMVAFTSGMQGHKLHSAQFISTLVTVSEVRPQECG